MRWLVLAIFIACAAYIHGRGKIRHGFFRQLSDHSTFMSALNGFIHLFWRVPSSHYLQSTFFPELARSGRIGKRYAPRPSHCSTRTRSRRPPNTTILASIHFSGAAGGAAI